MRRQQATIQGAAGRGRSDDELTLITPSGISSNVSSLVFGVVSSIATSSPVPDPEAFSASLPNKGSFSLASTFALIELESFGAVLEGV